MPVEVEPFVDGNGAVEGGSPEGFKALLSLFGLDPGTCDSKTGTANMSGDGMSVSSSSILIAVFSFPAGVAEDPFETLRLILSEPWDEFDDTRSPAGKVVSLASFSGLRFVAVTGVSRRRASTFVCLIVLYAKGLISASIDCVFGLECPLAIHFGKCVLRLSVLALFGTCGVRFVLDIAVLS
jgi:hypothetical protein